MSHTCHRPELQMHVVRLSRHHLARLYVVLLLQGASSIDARYLPAIPKALFTCHDSRRLA
eukprot:3058909-Pleurochrysis_carterae.AAC.3